MATVTLLGSTVNTTAGTHTVVATPGVNDFIVVISACTGASNSLPTDNNGTGTYSELATSATSKNSSLDNLQIFTRTALIGSAASTTFTQTTGGGTGGGLAVLVVKGFRGSLSFPTRNASPQNNQTAGGTPTPVLGATPLIGNAIIAAVFNATNPATMTPRSGYTELLDTGYATPTTGIEIMSLNSGETSSSIAWGGTSASAFGAFALELNCPQVALTGTATASITKNDIVAGGKTIILTLTDDAWVASGATFDAERQNIINGLTSAQSELNGWNNQVKAKIAVTDVVRTSSTVVTIVLDAEAGYNITAQETITATIPATALSSAIALIASPSFTVDPNINTSVSFNNYLFVKAGDGISVSEKIR